MRCALNNIVSFILKAVVAVLGAGVFYSAWLAVFLLSAAGNHPVLKAALWLLAPVMTAAGFAIGIKFSERHEADPRSRFAAILVWPLAGCTAGAATVCWFGVMLIVFGMFGAGTASVGLRELWLRRRETRG